MGGGAWSTTRKVRRGGGNDPSCGCDMQAGWPKFLTENIPLPSVGPSQPTEQKGGASCGIPPIPNYYQGGGGCACAGLPLPTPLQQGGGQPTYYDSNPVPDACPFPGTGYCGFYARGGSNPVSFSGSVQQNNGTERSFHGRFNDARNKLASEAIKELEALNAERLKPLPVETVKPVAPPVPSSLKPLPFKGKIMLWDPVGMGLWEKNPGGTKGKWVGKLNGVGQSRIINTTAKNYSGGANYGEPMYLQARLRGGKQRGGGCGCGARRGGSRPTKKNRAALKKWRKGQSIGFTMTSSLKAKGLIPRTSRKHRGKKVISAKYK